MAGTIQLNVRINEECRRALERYRINREKVVQQTIPEFRLSLSDAFRMLVLDAVKSDEKEIK